MLFKGHISVCDFVLTKVLISMICFYEITIWSIANSDNNDKDQTYIAPSDSRYSVESEKQNLSSDDQSEIENKHTRKLIIKYNTTQWKKTGTKLPRNSLCF